MACIIAVAGLIGCVTLVVSLPPAAIVTGVVTLAVGVLLRLVAVASRR